MIISGSPMTGDIFFGCCCVMESIKSVVFPSQLENLNEILKNQKRIVSLITIISTLSIVPVGYHIIALNVPTITIQNAFLSNLYNEQRISLSKGYVDILWALIVACQAIGAFVGCLFLYQMEKSFGTKRALMLYNNIILLIASILLFISFYFNTLLFLIIGRLLVGVYTGISCALVPIYVQEMAPKHIKGALSCFVHIGVCAGSALGAFLSIENILGGPSTWHLLLALPAVFGLTQIALNSYTPDTPNHYLNKGNKTEAANSIKFYYALENYNDDAVIREYKQLVTKIPAQVSIPEAFSDSRTQKGIILGIIVSATQVLSGSMAVVSYSTSMFTIASFTKFIIPFIPTLGSLFSIVLTIPALRLVETCGRKNLLIKTLIICAAANYLMTFFSLISEMSGTGSWGSIGFAFTFLLFGIGYNVGAGPVAYFIPGELVPPNASGVALGCGVAINWITTMITNLIYYPLIQFIGGWSYLLFAIPTTIAIIILQYELPQNVGDSTPKEEEELVLTCNLNDYLEGEEEGDSPIYGTFDRNDRTASGSSIPNSV